MAMRKNQARWIESRQRWQINVQKDGERRTFTSSKAGTKGKIEAERKADKWLEEGIRNNCIRLKRLYVDFLVEVKNLTSTPNYIKHEQIGRLWLLPRLEHKRVNTITPQDWQDCINDAYKAGKSKHTLTNIRGSITALYAYARKNRIQMEYPEGLIIKKDAPVAEKKILQPADLKKLFSIDTVTKYGKTITEYFIHAYRFIVLTGLRRGELCGLMQDDVLNNVVFVRRTVNSLNEITQGKTDNARRYFALPDKAKEVLEAQKQMLKKRGIISPYLFPDERGEMLDPNHLYKMWRAYCSQHDIHCTLHELRHTMISVSKAEVPEELLKRVVGHSKSMDTFGEYGHLVDGEIEKVASILNETFNLILK